MSLKLIKSQNLKLQEMSLHVTFSDHHVPKSQIAMDTLVLAMELYWTRGVQLQFVLQMEESLSNACQTWYDNQQCEWHRYPVQVINAVGEHEVCLPLQVKSKVRSAKMP